MKLTTPEISWHARDPVYTVDFQCGGKNGVYRLASAGADTDIRLWKLKLDNDGKGVVEFVASLTRHTKAVNVVRYSPNGLILASGGDEGIIYLWQLNESQQANNINIAFREGEEENKESWTVIKTLRGHLEDVYDISWSADSKYLLSGSVDNSAMVWDVSKGQHTGIWKEHKSFIQGVAWDPLGQYFATLSCDRTCRVYSIQSKRVLHNISKLSISSTNNNGENYMKQCRMFHDDSMRSFFRRLTFTPDGELLIVPSGCVEVSDQTLNTTYVFSRSNLAKPVVHLSGPQKATIAVRCCPILFELRRSPKTEQETEMEIDTEVTSLKGSEENNKDGEEKCKEEEKEKEKIDSLFSLPYRIVFAVATEDTLLFYDTQQNVPFAYITDIHYHQLSDIAWSSDGQVVVVSSTDGYCSIISFEPDELGTPYKRQVEEKAAVTNKNTEPMEKDSTNQSTKMDVIETITANQTAKTDISQIKSANQTKASPALNVPASSKNESQPRRIQLTSLSSQPSTLTSTDSSAKKPKRITPTLLTSATTPSQKTEDKPETSAAKPRRIQLVTL
ncbi:chromatin assembly factor 1 subunit B-like [Saccoglossus kowalevskii]|uniref:Chromatin assembly factor 1 subunit B-like n=1 Tax=Saccoglossus kowalevskii TaxID=10224 RepID=A0ABM0LVS6_SACKO|nr:PREDICTED: chromatin assembly factor 1 subunit B-like [Saccoglossus kowalevskii]